MWRNSEIIEELTAVMPLRPDPPPTPRLSATTRVQWRRSDPDQVEPLSTSQKKEGAVDEPRRGRSKTVTQKDGKDYSNLPLPPVPPKQTYEQRTEARRRSEEQSQRNVAVYIKDMEEEQKHVTYSPADDGGVNLKPLTPLRSEDPPLKPLTPLPPDHQSQKPGVARKRGASVAKLEAERANRIIAAEKEWMSDDLIFREWAQDSREELYGEGFSVAETRLFLAYPTPTRNTNEINRELYDMTLRDQDYQIGGPPRAVDINNIDWDTDLSNIQGYREFQQAMEAKAFASYAMYTERQEEIDMLRRMQVHGYLRDGVDIRYGYQAQGPHGAVAWLTDEGQEIGGRLREKFEQEKAVAGEFVISVCLVGKGEVGARSSGAAMRLRAVHADLLA
jgi:hypothetical protein